MLVCWSGGCDSTMMLLHLIQQMTDGCTCAHKWHEIRAITFKHPQLWAEAEQAHARQQITEQIKQRFPGVHLQQNVISMSYSEACIDGDIPNGLTQPQFWLIAQSYLHQDEDLYIGYIRGDDALSRLHQIETAFYALQQIGGKTGKLLFPLNTSGWGKVEIINMLREWGVYDLCWYCSHPKNGKPCGYCTSCLTHGAARWRIEQFDHKSIEKSGKIIITHDDKLQVDPKLDFDIRNGFVLA
jgi:7-cyano-7-deazaguanine synthase in queuosine biosynthesis